MLITIARGMLLGAITGCLLSQTPPANPESIRVINSIDGPTLYKTYCAVCHGVNGKGDGPVAPLLKTLPPDLTLIAHRHNGKFPREAVERSIMGDSQHPSAHGTRAMPIWGPVFSQIAWDLDLGRVRAYNLATYLEGIQSK